MLRGWSSWEWPVTHGRTLAWEGKKGREEREREREREREGRRKGDGETIVLKGEGK